MSSLPALLILLAQTPEPAPNPSTVAARMVQTILADPNTQGALKTVALALALAALLNILACWIASKVVADAEKSGFFSALKLWMLSVLASLGLMLVLAIGLAVAVSSNQPAALVAVFAGWMLLGIFVAFLLPMRVYDLGFGRALIFLIVAVIVSAAGQTAITKTLNLGGLVRPDLVAQLQSLPAEDRQRYLREVLSGTPTDPIDAGLDRLTLPAERARPILERQATLKAIFVQLEARYRALPPDNAPALESYQRLRARYEKQLTQLRAEFAASQQPPATP